MKFLFTSQPGYGHFFPLVPIAQCLRNAGHEVVFAMSGSFSGIVRNLGFGFFSVANEFNNWEESYIERTFPDISQIPQSQKSLWIYQNIFLERVPIKVVPELLEIVRDWPPDVIVSSAYELSGQIAGEITNIPYATINISLRMPSAMMRQALGQQYSSLRAHFKLSPDPEFNAPNRYLALSLMPRFWSLPGYRPRKRERFIRPDFYQQISDIEKPEWIDKLPNMATVYASLGTVFNRIYPQVFDIIVEAFRGSDKNLIMTVGQNGDTDNFKNLPPNIRVERYIPQTLLNHHLDVCINHGGYGTVMSSLTAGVPLVILPLSGDEPLIAAVCELKGVAPKIDREAFQVDVTAQKSIDPKKLTPEIIISAVEEVLHNEIYQKSAKKISDDILNLPKIDQSLRLLENIAEQRHKYG